jgi:hypothetical protein
MLARINRTAKRWAKHPLLGIRVGFAIPLNRPNPQGLPDPEENLMLNQIEDIILAHLKLSGPTIHVLSLTTGTFRECVLYVENGGAVGAVHKRLQSEIESHELQCVAEDDPKWTVYSTFS